MKGFIYMKKRVGESIYIGCTFNLKNRARNHKCELDVIEEVVVLNKPELIKIENYWIEQFRQWGFVLENRIANLSYKLGDKPVFKHTSISMKIETSVVSKVRKVTKHTKQTISGFISLEIEKVADRKLQSIAKKAKK